MSRIIDKFGEGIFHRPWRLFECAYSEMRHYLIELSLRETSKGCIVGKRNYTINGEEEGS